MNKTWNSDREQQSRRTNASREEAAAKQRDDEEYEDAIKSLNRMGEREIERALAGTNC